MTNALSGRLLPRHAGLSAVAAGALLLSAAPAFAQGPGVGNPAPNIGNFGSCLVTQALMAGAFSPPVYATSNSPGVFIERGEDDFHMPHEGTACTVGLFPPPPGVGQR
jgi:hypothetical protein